MGICTLMFSLTALGILGSLLRKNSAGTRDFVSSTGLQEKQLAQRADPYDVNAITQIKISAGFPKEIPALVMTKCPFSVAAGLSAGGTPCLRQPSRCGY